MTTFSVISNSINKGSMPVSAKTRRTDSTNPACLSSTGERLIETGIGGKPAARHWFSCSQVVRNTHAPSATMVPLVSAAGINASGEIVPRCGCVQRDNASTPTMASFKALTLG